MICSHNLIPPLDCKSFIACLTASSASTEQCILTGGNANSSAISVFLISEIYSITLEFTYLFLINAIMMAIVSVFIIFLPMKNNRGIATQD